MSVRVILTPSVGGSLPFFLINLREAFAPDRALIESPKRLNHLSPINTGNSPSHNVKVFKGNYIRKPLKAVLNSQCVKCLLLAPCLYLSFNQPEALTQRLMSTSFYFSFSHRWGISLLPNIVSQFYELNPSAAVDERRE